MSFILDALKKSETERQEQGSAEFASVPTSSGNSSPAKWLWMLAGLLLVNFAALLVILMRPDAAVEPGAGSMTSDNGPIATEETTAPASGSFEQQVAAAIDEQPDVTAQIRAPSSDEASTDTVLPPPQTVSRPANRPGSIATIDQLRLDGSLQLEQLHLDIHVFSENPGERFVFINMDKYREDERIDEGPVVREITPDGVILEYQGRDFLLPRQ